MLVICFYVYLYLFKLLEIILIPNLTRVIRHDVQLKHKGRSF